jgi:hypothetical protein
MPTIGQTNEALRPPLFTDDDLADLDVPRFAFTLARDAFSLAFTLAFIAFLL